jgi:hypothetical protein
MSCALRLAPYALFPLCSSRTLEEHLGPRPFLHELPGLRLPRDVLLQPTAGVRKLRLHIENRSTSKARARRVVVFSKYWIINRTNLLLFFATRGQAKEPTVCNPQQVRGRGGREDTGMSFG